MKVVVAGCSRDTPADTSDVMSTPELAAILDRVTYKPGWSIRVYDGRYEGQHVVIRTVLPDAYDTAKTVTIDVHSMLPPMADQDAFLSWLLWRLARIEVHECREFLRIDSQVYADPHGPLADHDLG